MHTVGTLLAHRSRAPAALWTVPAILPLPPAPSTLLPLLAETEAARQALQGQAVSTAFSIGVGAASGSVVVETWLCYRERALQPAVGALSQRLSVRVPRAGAGADDGGISSRPITDLRRRLEDSPAAGFLRGRRLAGWTPPGRGLREDHGSGRACGCEIEANLAAAAAIYAILTAWVIRAERCRR